MISKEDRSYIELLNDVFTVISGEVKKIDYKVMPLGRMDDALEEYDFYKLDIDTNGWEVDYWAIYQHEDTGEKIYLSGSMYYGTCRISKIEYNDQ